jgi:hypothetical protein
MNRLSCLALLCLFLGGSSAAAQLENYSVGGATRAPSAEPGRPHRPSEPFVEAGFQFSEPEGFRTRETFSKLAMPLGRAGSFRFSSLAHFSHMAVGGEAGAPAELYKSGAGITMETGGKTLKLGVDSNSDRPFYGMDTINFDATYTFTLSEKKGHALLGGLNYSSQRSFARNIPFPFIVYRYQSENFLMIFPFMYRFQLSEHAALNVTYAPVKNLKASLRWQASPDFYADLEAGGELDQFLQAKRADKSERFYYQRYTAALKPSVRVSPNLRLACALGYFFSGYYYTGKTYDDYRGKTAIGAAPYFSLSLKYSTL